MMQSSTMTASDVLDALAAHGGQHLERSRSRAAEPPECRPGARQRGDSWLPTAASGPLNVRQRARWRHTQHP